MQERLFEDVSGESVGKTGLPLLGGERQEIWRRQGKLVSYGREAEVELNEEAADSTPGSEIEPDPLPPVRFAVLGFGDTEHDR